MSLVKLAKERLRYNPKTGKCYWKFKVNNRAKDEAGTISKNRGGPRCIIRINGKGYLRARIAFILMNEPIPKIVDHINRNTLDDRWDNLRPANKAQNAWNTKPRIRTKNKLFPPGIKFDKRTNKYSFAIQTNGKREYFGTFETMEAAYEKYLEIKKLGHGEFAA